MSMGNRKKCENLQRETAAPGEIVDESEPFKKQGGKEIQKNSSGRRFHSPRVLATGSSHKGGEGSCLRHQISKE